MSSLPRGYQVFEFDRLHPLVGNSQHHGFATAILGWVAHELQSRFDPTRTSIEIDVIKVKYIGPYPALGVRYLTQESYENESLAEDIRIAGEEIINESIMSRFVDFAGNSRASWNERYDDLRVPGAQYYESD